MKEYDEKQITRLLSSNEILSGQRDLLVAFDRESEKNDGLAIATRRSQLVRIHALAKAVPKNFLEMTRQDIETYIYGLDMKISSIDLSKIYIKKFFKWLYRSENCPDVVKWIKVANHKKRTLPEDILTPANVKALIDATDNLRDRALLSVLYESGCRLGEIIGLKQKDVEPDQYGVIIRVTGKTGPRRLRLINSAPDLVMWLNNHPHKGSTMPVFNSNKFPTKPLGESSHEALVKKAAKKAGFENNVYPHLLRHSRATHLAKKMTDAELKKYFGWVEESRMLGTYVSLSDNDIHKKILEINGLITAEEAEKENNVLKARKCPRCKESNPSTARFCYRCGMVLDVETAAKIDKENSGIALEMIDLLKQQPRLLEILRKFEKEHSSTNG